MGVKRGLAAVLSVALAVLAAGAEASDTVRSLAGDYDGGQTEVAAGLRLGEDGRFDYFMSYGALDETSSGTWTVDEGRLVLTSDPVEAPAFELTASGEGAGDAFHVTLELPPGLPTEAFSALVTLADGTRFASDFGSDGLNLELAPGEDVAAIMLALPIYEVRSEEFAVPPDTGRMTFRFVPNDLGTVSFVQAVLPKRNGAFLLERFDRVLEFRKVSRRR
jgi:hypothetical protein